MSEIQQRIREDLVDELDGEIRTDEVTLGVYSTDASLYEIRPKAVAFPRGPQDVVTLLRYATENHIPVIPRGGGSGVAGGCLGDGIVIDFSRTMRRMLEIDGQTVRVEPGINRNALNRQLASEGLYFAPDPANAESTTIGSMIAVNAGGSHSIRVGATRDHVASMRLALADGNEISVGDRASTIETIRDHLAASEVDVASRLSDIERTLARIVSGNAEAILQKQSGFVSEACGYFLRTLAQGQPGGLRDLIVGSEGTLGIVTEATLHLNHIAPYRGAILALFGSLDDAVAAVLSAEQEQPAACDLLDRRLLTLARDNSDAFAECIPATAEAALVIDFHAQAMPELQSRLDRMEQALRSGCPSVRIGLRVTSPAAVERLWDLPQRVVPMLARLPGAARPLPFVEDIHVPPQQWPEFLPRVQKVMQRHQVTSSFYAHALAGKIHMRPFLPLPTTVADRDQIESIARDVYNVVFEFGGTMSSEHGDGFSRTAFVRSRYRALYPAFRDVKRLFDPDGVLNPDKIVSDDQRITVRHIRVPAQVVDFPLQLRWPGESFTAEINACNGCGDCRRKDPGSRMCPLFRLDSDEIASPRAKANILRSLLDGTGPLGKTAEQVLASREMRELTKTCFNCKQCRIDCPSQVDIPRLVSEAKAADVATNGLRGASWSLSRAHSFGKFGCAISPLANWMLSNGTARWLMEKAIGISRQRKLPRFARRPFLSSLRKETFTPTSTPAQNKNGTQKQNSQEVVYFVDYFANYHDVELAAATVAVLRHNGWTVHVPAGQQASGMAMISAGDIEAVRELAEENVRVLARYVGDGMPIVCSEPAAVLCLREEYPRVLDHLDVAHIAGAITGIGELLLEQHLRGELRTDFCELSMRVLVHTPCHIKATLIGHPLRQLLTLIPGLEVQQIEKGCSGMAGAYGLIAENFEASMKIGWELTETMRTTDANAGSTSCSACRLQMEQRTGRPTLHPIKLLAAAYGLLPNFIAKLQPNRARLTVSQ